MRNNIFAKTRQKKSPFSPRSYLLNDSRFFPVSLTIVIAFCKLRKTSKNGVFCGVLNYEIIYLVTPYWHWSHSETRNWSRLRGRNISAPLRHISLPAENGPQRVWSRSETQVLQDWSRLWGRNISAPLRHISPPVENGLQRILSRSETQVIRARSRLWGRNISAPCRRISPPAENGLRRVWTRSETQKSARIGHDFGAGIFPRRSGTFPCPLKTGPNVFGHAPKPKSPPELVATSGAEHFRTMQAYFPSR